MARRKQKSKRRRHRIVLLAALGIAVVASAVALLWWLGGLVADCFKDDSEGEAARVSQREPVDPELLRRDSLLAQDVEHLIARSNRLDSTLLGVYLYDATTKQTVYEHDGNKLFIPASCMKIPTAIAALEVLGMDHRYRTALLMQGDMVGDTLMGRLLLRADDDPMLLTLDTLAVQLREAGIHAVRGTCDCELAREDVLDSHPSTQTWDIRVGRVPLLMRGKSVVGDGLRASLSRSEVDYKVDKNVQELYKSFAKEGELQEVASVETPLTDVITPMLIYSSNVKAEAVLFHLDCHEGLIADKMMHWDQKHAIRVFWERQFDRGIHFPGVDLNKMRDMVMVDGSGLSPMNRLAPSILVDMLRYAWEREDLRNYLIDEALASPGHPQRRGSLRGRMSGEAFRNRIFVKTGTLTSEGVSSLAGYIHGTDDHWYIFCIFNQRCPVDEGRLFQDEFCRLFVR